MIESQEQLKSVFNTMKLSVTFDFIPKFTKCIASYIGNCIDKVVRHQKDTITKRLRKRRHRLFVSCKYRNDKIKCKCDCKRCIKYKQIPNKSISRRDFITNFVCNNRSAEDAILKASTDRNQMRQALDLTTGWEWWMKMQQSAACMPSLQNDVAASTKSVSFSASSRSYFDSCSTLTELDEEIDEIQTNSTINSQVTERSSERRGIEKRLHQPREGSKSDSKFESGRNKTKCSSIFKSASTKTTCVRSSMNKRRNLALTKQRFGKRRPCLDPSVRYFKNLSKKK